MEQLFSRDRAWQRFVWHERVERVRCRQRIKPGSAADGRRLGDGTEGDSGKGHGDGPREYSVAGIVIRRQTCNNDSLLHQIWYAEIRGTLR